MRMLSGGQKAVLAFLVTSITFTVAGFIYIAGNRDSTPVDGPVVNTVTITDTSGYSNSTNPDLCNGRGRFADVRPGAEVLVFYYDGEVYGRATLDTGFTIPGLGCMFTYGLKDTYDHDTDRRPILWYVNIGSLYASDTPVNPGFQVELPADLSTAPG